MTLAMRAPETARVHSHLCGAYPEEGCGILVGREAGGVRDITMVLPVANRRQDSRANRFLIAPEDFLAADREARAAGFDVLGFFHSHPDHAPEPSEFDREHAWPWYTYLIVSVERGRVTAQRAWRLRDDRSRFEPEPIETPPPGGNGDGR